MATKVDKRVKEYKQETDLEHARHRTSMYLGGKIPLKSEEYMMQSPTSIGLFKILISPAALKCPDEIIVNAIDQWVKTRGKTNIWITANPDTGVITVRNDGSCVPVCETKTRDGKTMMLPQFLFCEFRTSGNFNTEDEDRLTGGTFGFGATLVNAFSKTFIVETLDHENKLFYRQQTDDCMSKINPPEIEPADDDEKPWTQFSILLNYKDFGMEGRKDLMDTFIKMIYMRAVHTAVYIAPQRVYWNDKQIEIQSPRQLVCAHLSQRFDGNTENIKCIDFNLLNKGLLWRISIGFQPPEGFEHVTLVNGIYAKNGGSHVDHITDQIVAYVKEKYMAMIKKNTKEKAMKFNKNMILKYLFLFMAIQINKPSFTGQRKDQLDTPQEQFADVIIHKSYLDVIWKYMTEFIEMDLLDKSADTNKAVKKRKKIKAKKYTPAAMAGTDQAPRCGLFIAEGDSAVGTVTKLVTSSKSRLDKRLYGIYSIQGVPVNARKETTMKRNPRTGGVTKIRSTMYQENERLNTLIQILNLDRSKTYDLKSELATLNYGFIIIATDQDEDGKGNIRSQIKNFFQTEWPWLIIHGFVRFMVTPIVRAYHKNGTDRVQEFRTETDYSRWKDTIKSLDDYEIVYYKGLGSHSDTECDHMAEHLPDMIVTVTADQRAEDEFEIYFGEDTSRRKTALRVPPTESEEYYTKNGVLNIVDHLRTETKSFQLYNIRRHIPGIDGMLPTTRKAVYGAQKKFGHNNARCKVYQLTGFIAEHVNYHHGNASADAVITGLAQDYPGSNVFPLLRALSNFGTRMKGGTDAGHPRYIYTKLNKQLCESILPSEDNYLLEYTYDDGKQGEPVRYVPVVPMAILESYKSPAHGWASTIWARDFDEVYTYVLKCVEEGQLIERKEDFSPYDMGTGHQLVYVKGVPWSLGRYRRTGPDSVVITNLPVRKWNEQLIHGNLKVSAKKKEEKKKAKKGDDEKKNKGWDEDPNVVDVDDQSDVNTRVEINVTFTPGFLESLMKDECKGGIDPVLNYLKLKQSLKSNLNFIGLNGAVIEFTTYLQVLQTWFPIRKQLYADRINRQLILNRLRIMMLKEKLRFAHHRHEYRLNEMGKKQQEKVVQEQKYQTIDHGLLERPKFTRVSQLENLILNGPGASWDYLLKMNSLSMNTEGIKKMTNKIAELEAEVAELTKPEKFPGCRAWLSDLKTLAEVVKKGRREGWGAWDVKPKWI